MKTNVWSPGSGRVKARMGGPLVMLALVALSAQALADTDVPMRLEPKPRLAQMGPEERRQWWWERLPPEEQARVRQQLREELLELPPEQRELRRREILEGWREPRERGPRMREMQERRGYPMEERPYPEPNAGRGFGFGYERRQERDERPGRR